jgi:hypothetical protein
LTVVIPESGAGLPSAAGEIAEFILAFEACTLPKPRWTHQAHLLVGLWYLSKHTAEEALDIVRRRIRAYNEAVGTPNTDHSGYHETLTRFYLKGIRTHMERHRELSMTDSLALLLKTPLARSDWPLSYYSRRQLFSRRARHEWVAPDLQDDGPAGDQ